MNIFLVIPAYNEQTSLRSLAPLLANLPYSILFVNDCSSDSTLDILTSYPEIKVISNQHNFGYSESLRIGISKAFEFGASHVITLDSDGQHPLDILPFIVERFAAGTNCVLTIRSGPKPRLSEQLLGFVSQFLWSVPDIYCGMRGFSRSFWLEFFSPNTNTPCMEYPFLKSLISGYRPDLISINALPRLKGKPRFSSRFSADLLILKSFFQSIFIP